MQPLLYPLLYFLYILCLLCTPTPTAVTRYNPDSLGIASQFLVQLYDHASGSAARLLAETRVQPRTCTYSHPQCTPTGKLSTKLQIDWMTCPLTSHFYRHHLAAHAAAVVRPPHFFDAAQFPAPSERNLKLKYRFKNQVSHILHALTILYPHAMSYA